MEILIKNVLIATAMKRYTSYRKNIGNLARLDKGSTCQVYKIASETPLVLKVIDCGFDETKYHNSLYEKRIMECVNGCSRTVSMMDFDITDNEDGQQKAFVLERYYKSLEQFAISENYDINTVLGITIDLCDAVQEIMEKGVFHLDLKPKNIFLDSDNKIKLGDFGSALFEGDLSKNQSLRGTLEYMAPEVYQEHKCSEQSEIYSIGLILYYLLNKLRLPFVDEENDKNQKELAVYKRLAGTNLPLLSFQAPKEIADDINALIRNVCAYDTENRIKTVKDLRSDLKKIQKSIVSHKFVFSPINRPLLKRVLPIIYMIDSSGSMDGERIACLNNAMHESLEIIREKNHENPDCEIRIAVLKFSSGAEWVTKGLVRPDEFCWNDLFAGGVTNLGEAIRELDSKLSKNAFLNGFAELAFPFIICVSDGSPTDNWKKELKHINNNNAWFRNARKICIAISEDADLEVLETFSGNSKEGVIRAYNIKDLKSYIVAISESASMMSRHQIGNVTNALIYDPCDADSVAYSCIVCHSISDIKNDFSSTVSPGPLSDISNSDNDSGWGDDSWDVDTIATSVAIFPPEQDNDTANSSRSLMEDLHKEQRAAMNSERNSQIHFSQNTIKFEKSEPDKFEGIIIPDKLFAGGVPHRCRMCDELIFSGAQFCPYCGSKVVIGKPIVELSQVEFSAVAPKRLVKGEYSIIDIVMYEEAYRHIVDEIHRQSDTETQEKRAGKMHVPVAADIKVSLDSPDLDIENNEICGVWQSSYLDFSFHVFLPDNYSKKQVLFIAKVYINDIIATRLSFSARCSSLFEQKISIKREDVLSAFISYASQDRKRVAAIVQGMQRARPDMDVFFDVESLRTGDNWEKILYREIEKRDVLYLCWSHFARDSEWVNREWRYAFSSKGN